MGSSDRGAAAKGVAAKVAMASMLAVGAAVASAGTAAADPLPPAPADPATPDAPPPPAGFIPPPSTIGSTLAQDQDNGQPIGPGGLPGCFFANPANSDSGSGPCPDFLLSQYATPATSGQPATIMGGANALSTAGYLLPPNIRMSEQGQGPTFYGLTGDDNAPITSRWDAISRARGAFHDVMGHLDQDQLGDPLPGTAPPPGTNLPVGTNW
jgi:hypothetical protein